MKLKNIMEDVRKLSIDGQIIYVKPGESIEVESAKYDSRVFEEIKLKRNEKNEEIIKLKEDK